MDKRQEIEEIAKIADSDPAALTVFCQRHNRLCDFVCASCGSGICLDCIKESGFDDPLLCRRCIQMEQLRELSFVCGIRSYLNPPFLWVAFCILAASIAFIFGIGRPNLKIYSSEHSVLPWYSWRDAVFLLSKGSRQKRRAFFLRQVSKKNEALKWAESSADYFERCSEIWKENNIQADLLFAAYALRAEFKSVPNYLLQLKELLPHE